MTFFFLSAEVMPNWPFFKACPTGRFGQSAGVNLNDNVIVWSLAKAACKRLETRLAAIRPHGASHNPRISFAMQELSDIDACKSKLIRQMHKRHSARNVQRDGIFQPRRHHQ